MPVSIGVAHAAFLPERRRTLDRLLTFVPGAHVSRSEKREHASVWAKRLWQWAAEQPGHAVMLNDDVYVSPFFDASMRAIVEAVPDQVIALHTTAPVAGSLLSAGERWLRSFWLTGPGYIFPPGVAKRVLAWAAAHPSITSVFNEDNVVMHWAWSEQRPIWHTIPAMVEHDTTVPSTLGYDAHGLRAAEVSWSRHAGLDLTTASAWKPRGEPLLVECPWMPRIQLAQIERAQLMGGGRICTICLSRPPLVSKMGSGGICGQCLTDSVAAVSGAKVIR